jgi:broad specificity phosphatase PhoE
MTGAALAGWASVDSGDVVFVSHQLPIWMTYRSAQGLSLPHNPRNRRCSLSSITSFDVVGGKLVPVDYREPGLRHAGLI